MGLYSELLNDGRILADIGDAKKIAIITCPGCACESIAYRTGGPCRTLAKGKDMDSSAAAVEAVRDEWDRKLSELGKTVTHATVSFPCEMFENERNAILRASEAQEIVAVLGCSSAFLAIYRLCKDRSPAKVIPMMKTLGVFALNLVEDETGSYSVVDREHSEIFYHQLKKSAASRPVR